MTLSSKCLITGKCESGSTTGDGSVDENCEILYFKEKMEEWLVLLLDDVSVT